MRPSREAFRRAVELNIMVLYCLPLLGIICCEERPFCSLDCRRCRAVAIYLLLSDGRTTDGPNKQSEKKKSRRRRSKMSFPGRAVQRTWHLVDATSQTVGRLATTIAPILKGKHKPTYRPNGDCGDYVVIVNADKVWLLNFICCLLFF